MAKVKGVMCTIIIVIAVFLAGCLDYKAYDIETQEDASLIDEIAAIEEGLTAEPTGAVVEEVPTVPEEVEEEVILPELGEETEDLVAEDDLDVITIKENELVRLNVRVTDPDKDVVTYTYSRPLNTNGEWKTNYGDAGEYIVTITASDGTLTTEKKVKLMVERVNVAQMIEVLQDITVREGETVVFEPVVSDPNNDAVTVTVSEPLTSGNWNTDHTSAGEYQIRVVATDGELETEQVLTLLVEDVNVLPEVSDVPATITVQEGDTVTLTPTATDIDDDPITITISDPIGNDGVWETEYTDHGTYVVTVTITDGKDKIVKKVNVQVTDVNQPPMIEDVYVESS